MSKETRQLSLGHSSIFVTYPADEYNHFTL
jgi:hypothetical protein